MAKVLVIDDEQGIRSLLDMLLSRKGYGVVLADGGRKGLELFRRERPDVIVLDCEPCRENIDLVQSVFESEVIRFSNKGDLSAVVERLDTLIPATVTTH